MDDEMMARLLSSAEGGVLERPREVLVLVASTRTYARDLLERAVAAAERRGCRLARVSRASGRESIEFEHGGRVRFGRPGDERGWKVDLAVVSPSILLDAQVMLSLTAAQATSTSREVWVMAGPVPLPAVDRSVGRREL